MSGRSRQSESSEIALRNMLHCRFWRLKKHSPEDFPRLDKLLAQSPHLAAAYRFVQQVYSTHDKKYLSPDKARKRVLKAWSALPVDTRKYFSKFNTAITESSEEYFANWADSAQSNGVTEAKNRTLRDHQRAGRGLEFAELRSRAIYTMSLTERMRRAKLGLPGPIERVLALNNGESFSHQVVRTVSRHGRHKPGRRPRKKSPKQLNMFPDHE